MNGSVPYLTPAWMRGARRDQALDAVSYSLREQAASILAIGRATA